MPLGYFFGEDSCVPSTYDVGTKSKKGHHFRGLLFSAKTSLQVYFITENKKPHRIGGAFCFCRSQRLFRNGCRGLGFRSSQQGLHAELHAPLVVHFQHLHAHNLAFLEVVGHAVDTLMGNLRDVQQAILAR